MAASIFTITAMSLDRYLNITQPFGFARWFNKKSTIIMIFALWIISIVLFFPVVVVMEVREELPDFNIKVCVEGWQHSKNDTLDATYKREVMGIVWFVSMFAIPGKFLI